jgi:hypothetical protein
VIANTGVDDIDRSLAKLYAEDADWNALVEALSTARIERQVRRAEMFKGFVGDLSNIPLQTLEPKMNAVLYRTSCNAWEPLCAEELYNPGTYRGMKINQHRRIAIFATRSEEQAGWTTAQHVINVTWDLHMMYWDQEKEVLYISSSTNGPYDSLAKAVCGETTHRIEGEEVFRSLAGFRRLILRNLGLTHHQGRGVRYSMYMGVDVADGLATAKSQSRIKNNLFATGFLDGLPATRGCSAKGKFWSISPVRDLTDWTGWCDDIGRAVNDPSITTDSVFKSAMRPRQINERPAVSPSQSIGRNPCSRRLRSASRLASTIIRSHSRNAISSFSTTIRRGHCALRCAATPMWRSSRSNSVVVVPATRSAPVPRPPSRMGNKVRTLSESFSDDSPQIDFGDGSLL